MSRAWNDRNAYCDALAASCKVTCYELIKYSNRLPEVGIENVVKVVYHASRPVLKFCQLTFTASYKSFIS